MSLYITKCGNVIEDVRQVNGKTVFNRLGILKDGEYQELPLKGLNDGWAVLPAEFTASAVDSGFFTPAVRMIGGMVKPELEYYESKIP